MTEVSGQSGQRPPTEQRGGAKGRASSGLTMEVLRRRLAKAETHLREMEDEAHHVATQQACEIEAIQNEHRTYHDRLELLRMEECMTPAELEALKVDAKLSFSAAKGKGTGSARQAAVDSKLLASSSVKYKQSRDLVTRKRTECEEVEANLAAARNHLTELRNRRHTVRRATQGSVYAATVRKSRVSQLQSQSREQLRGLEVHVAMEQEQLSAMVTDSKRVRSEVDGLLITQSRFEKSYRQREDQLLEKKKQMTFLVEVCTLLFEEREEKHRELAELHALSEEENRKYEGALEELNAVLIENKRVQAEIDEKIAAVRHELRDTQKERVTAEKANDATERQLQRSKEKLRQQQARRLNGVDGPTMEDSDLTVDELANTGHQQINECNLFYERLAELAGSNILDDVVCYTDTSAEERFRFFSELNYLHDETAKLEEERNQLLGLGADAAGGAAASARARQHCQEEEEDDEEEGGKGEGNGSGAGAMASATQRQREAREAEMQVLQQRLDQLKLSNIAEGEEREALDQTYETLLAQVRQAFTALGCDPAVIREQSGVESVLRTNLPQCLALVEQRTEEYLLTLARGEQVQQLQLQLREDDEAAAAMTAPPKHSVARTFLRRPDLPPPVAHGSGTSKRDRAAALNGDAHTPRFLRAPGAAAGAANRSLSAKQLVSQTRGGLPRSVDPHPTMAAAAARATGVSGHSHGRHHPQRTMSSSGMASHASNVPSASQSLRRTSAGRSTGAEEDVPLSLTEMQRLVREKRNSPAAAAVLHH